MTFEEFVDHVDEYLDGVLPPEEVARVEACLRDDPACRAELEEAEAFRALLHGRGRDALADLQARTLTEWVHHDAARHEERRRTEVESVLVEAAAASDATVRPVSRWWRPAAAATVLAAAAALAFVSVRDLAPDASAPPVEPVWAAGTTRVLEAGSHELLAPGVQLTAAGRTALTRRGDDAYGLVGAGAHVSVAEDREFRFETPRGMLTLVGATAYVAIDDDGALRLVVGSGAVAFSAGAGGEHRLLAGESLVAPVGRRVEILSRAAVDALRADYELQSFHAHDLRGRLREATEALAAERAAPPAETVADVERRRQVPFGSDDVLDELPWGEFGRAARQLLRSNRGRGLFEDPVQARALAVFLEHTGEIQALTGVQNPIDGIRHPEVLVRIAEPFFHALAPHAPRRDIRNAAAATRVAAERIGAELAVGDLVPAERAMAELRMFRAMILAAHDHIGPHAAVETAAGLRGAGELAPVRPRRVGAQAEFESDYVALWGRLFDLRDDELLAARALVVAVQEDVLRAQSVIEGRLGRERARELLRLGRRGFWRGRSPVGETVVDRLDEAEARAHVERAVEDIEAKLELAAAQVEFERAMRDLVGPARRDRWDSARWHLRSFDVRSER